MTPDQRYVLNELQDLIDMWKQVQKTAEHRIEFLENHLACSLEALEPEADAGGGRP